MLKMKFKKLFGFFALLMLSLTLILALGSCSDECEHDFDEASCLEARTCAKCNITEGVALGHTGGTATCENKAVCTRCNEAYGELAEHDFDDASCMLPKTCSICGAVEGTAIGHTGGTATCENKAVCDRCHQPYGELAEHDFDDASCMIPKTCSVCGEVEGTALGHTGGTATCENKAVCDRCHQPYGELAEHDFDDASCTLPKTCSICGEVEGTALGHTGGTATCENKAVCDRCHQPYGELAEHKYTSETVAPTCLDDGFTRYTCSVCGDHYDDNFVDPTDHAYGAWFIENYPSLTSDGNMRRNCMNCSGNDEIKPLVPSAGGNVGPAGSDGLPGDKITYKFFEEDGTLKLEGSGAIFYCKWNGDAQPYIDLRSKIKRVIIGNGITTVSGGAFAYCDQIESLILAPSVTTISTNSFMGAFKSGVTSLTIPSTVTGIGTYAFGIYNGKGATFTDITIENPNVSFTGDVKYVFNGTTTNSGLRIYTYGNKSATNNVKSFAETIGAEYFDIDGMASGSVGDVSYYFSDGALSIAPAVSGAASLPADRAWESEISLSDVKVITISEGITHIPAAYFVDYIALNTVNLPKSLASIGDGAFSVSSACSEPLTIDLPDRISSLGEAIFGNRTNVTVTGYTNSAAEGFSEAGVSLNIKKYFRILLMGNSLTQDAADCTGPNTASKLYEILSSMLGDEYFVEVGIIYSGAKTATWHATQAEKELATYAFYLVSKETNNLWESQGVVTSKQALLYSNWDVVTIQPYASETYNGYGSMTESDGDKLGDAKKDEKFLSLSASLPFLLDHIDKYAPAADIYYYLTWGSSNDPTIFDAGLTTFNKMITVAKASMAYVGTESGKGFAGVINAGTAVQNARKTYLAKLSYIDPVATDQNQYGVQRDYVHISYNVGRYIVGLTFAELLIPEDMRAESYTLPVISDHKTVGALPAEYTEIARLVVLEAVKSARLTGDGQYVPTDIGGYKTDPADELKAKAESMTFDNISAANAASLAEAIKSLILADAKDGIKLTVTVNEALSSGTQSFTATVTIVYGFTTRTATVSGTAIIA